MAHLTTNDWTIRLSVLAVMIALLTVFMTVTVQADDPDWKVPVTGLTAVAGDDPGEMLITWDAHPQTTKTLQDYRVTWAPDGEPFKTNDQTDWYAYPTTNEVSVTGLDADQTYKVRVRARYNDNKKSRWSDAVNRTGRTAPLRPRTPQPPGSRPSREPQRSEQTLTADNLRHLRRQRTHEAYSPSSGVQPPVDLRSANGSDNDITERHRFDRTRSPTPMLIDKAIKVRVNGSFSIDDDGYSESSRLTSNATASVPVPAAGHRPVRRKNRRLPNKRMRTVNSPLRHLRRRHPRLSPVSPQPPCPTPGASSPAGSESATASGSSSSRLPTATPSLPASAPTTPGSKPELTAGHDDIQAYSDGFTVVGCTAAKDARDNTATTYTSSDKGVPIYWLDGNKAADEYQDFYDGSWDNESNSQDRNELGINSTDTSTLNNRPFTGCDHNGTEKVLTTGSVSQSRALGKAFVRVGRLNSSISSEGPLNGSSDQDDDDNRPMYGLSSVFTIVDQLSRSATSADARRRFAIQSQPFTTEGRLHRALTSDNVSTVTKIFRIAPTPRARRVRLNEGHCVNQSNVVLRDLQKLAEQHHPLFPGDSIQILQEKSDSRFFATPRTPKAQPDWTIGNTRFWRTQQATRLMKTSNTSSFVRMQHQRLERARARSPYPRFEQLEPHPQRARRP